MGKMIGANYGKTTASAFTAAAIILSLRLPCLRCVRSHLTRCVGPLVEVPVLINLDTVAFCFDAIGFA